MIPAPLMEPLAYVGLASVTACAALVIYLTLAMRADQKAKARRRITTDAVDVDDIDVEACV